MVKRVVDTDFWTDMEVIDQYSVEDKYFSLYLKTNGKTTQVGIYSLPKKVMSFETGFTTEVVQVLIDRFNDKYKKIIYSEETQEVAILGSLKYTILKGGGPVRDLLERELAKVKDGQLILATYEEMENFWDLSKRKFDQTIKDLFENELKNRNIAFNQNDNENQNDNYNDNYNDSYNVNDNDNEESYRTNRFPNQDTIRPTNREDDPELKVIERYIDYLKLKNPSFEGEINSTNILTIYYRELIGNVGFHIKVVLDDWKDNYPIPIILEALHRSMKATNPIPYAAKILENWEEQGVESYQDIKHLENKYNKN